MCIHNAYLDMGPNSMSKYNEIKQELTKLDIMLTDITPRKVQKIIGSSYLNGKRAKAFAKLLYSVIVRYKQFLVYSDESVRYLTDETYTSSEFWDNYFKMKRHSYATLILILPTSSQSEDGRIMLHENTSNNTSSEYDNFAICTTNSQANTISEFLETA
mgnify:CR=1 FL=1